MVELHLKTTPEIKPPQNLEHPRITELRPLQKENQPKIKIIPEIRPPRIKTTPDLRPNGCGLAPGILLQFDLAINFILESFSAISDCSKRLFEELSRIYQLLPRTFSVDFLLCSFTQEWSADLGENIFVRRKLHVTLHAQQLSEVEIYWCFARGDVFYIIDYFRKIVSWFRIAFSGRFLKAVSGWSKWLTPIAEKANVYAYQGVHILSSLLTRGNHVVRM